MFKDLNPPKPITKPTSQSIRGIGDVVHKVAQPIAKVIDKTLGTKIQKCGGCAKRREALNKALPFKT